MILSIPHEDIRRDEDRSWTARLLGWLVLPELPAAEREEIATTLSSLEDPRAEAPLTRILEARELPAAAREAAGAVLRSAGLDPGGAWLRTTWAEGDVVLRRHVLLSMGRAEADLVEPVARDPAHPLHKEAIETMILDFSEPRFLGPRIAALAHRDPAVRRVAADALVYDEPLAAEAPLLRAAGDPVVEVAVTALKTLVYYPSRRCLGAVAALCDYADDDVRAAAVHCVAALRDGSFRDALDHAGPAERRFLLEWMAPVRHLLGIPEEGGFLVDAPASPARRPTRDAEDAADDALATAELIALYTDLDGPWAEKKSRFPGRSRAARYAADRGVLVPFLAGHPDPWIRDRASELLSAWGEREALLGLTRDPLFMVRKSAMYWLGQLSPDPAVAAVAWEHLAEPGTTGTHAAETLAAYVRHAREGESIPRLLALVRADARDSVQAGALRALAALGARPEIAALLPLLSEPPRVTWAVHLVLLDACGRLGLHPGRCDALREADNLDVQRELARWFAIDPGPRGR
ncbi:hypothetical protein SOCE26_079420 [Sorangium cellulosum]|uniref:PBS lyase n=1 Tax=Sorangium cellulosum TaxID=56 RepID=A0A2L0F4G1_SORCE|nr:hypothetical protein [Sorangium cellulosum]AUX46436.1 hypothetical protein SOCE26_079420 [Sorangium cellulosum]